MLVVKKRVVPQISKTSNGTNYQYKNNMEVTSFLNHEDIPQEFKDNLVSKFIKPLESKLNNFFYQLHQRGTPDANVYIKKSLNAINLNLKNITENIDKIKLAEVQEGIADIGLKGFEMSLKLDQGLQMEIVPGSDNYDMFFDIVRQYIFKYPDNQWPPSPDKIQYFTYNSNEKQLCCFYWPLYGYIKTLFHYDFKGDINLTDLFILQNMQDYCEDFFKPVPKNIQQQQQQQQQQKKQKQQQKRPWVPRGGAFPQGQGQGQGQGQRGQFKPKYDQSKQGNKKQFNPEKGQDQQFNPEKGQDQQFKKSVFEQQQKQVMVSSNSQSCKPLKLKRVEMSLRKTIINVNENSNSFSNSVPSSARITEYKALHDVVRNYIKKLPNQDLIYGGVTIENFITSQASDLSSFTYPTSSIPKDIWDECKQVKISPNEYVILDPLTGSLITYGNIQKWFTSKPYPLTTGEGKSKKTIIVPLNDPCNVLTNGLQNYKSQYPLPSPMWRLQSNELKEVRTRFMKLLSFLLISLQKMYEDVKRQNIKDFGKEEELKKIKIFYKNLLNDIKSEDDSEKKKKLIDLKNSVEAKYSNSLKKSLNYQNPN